MISQLAQYLQDNGIGSLCTDIFINFQPSTPDNCISLFAYGGNAPDKDINRPGLQIRVRQTTDEAAELTANSIQNLLNGLVNTTIGGLWFIQIWANQSPEPLGRDGLGRPEYVQNFTVTYERGA